MPEFDPRDAAQLAAAWIEVVVPACQRRSREAASLVYVARPVSVVETPHAVLVTLRVRYAPHRARLLDDAIRPVVQGALAKVFGRPVAIDVLTPEGEAPVPARRPARRRAAPSARGGVRAIPTRYAGVQFRSRLEASAARLFDNVGLDWAFETEGYNLDGVWYLPDFWLDECRTFVETKGVFDDASVEKVKRLAVECAPRDILVVVVQNLRVRGLQVLKGVILGALVVADPAAPSGARVVERGATLARCPACDRATWKATDARRCRRCGAEQPHAEDFLSLRFAREGEDS